jgi:hypothetical protein
MDSFEFNPALFDSLHEPTPFKRTRPSSPREAMKQAPPPCFYEEASNLFYFLHEYQGKLQDKYNLIGELLTFLQANLKIPKTNLYAQENELGRWLQFIQFLFTNYTKHIKVHTKRQLRQTIVSIITEELHRANVYSNV